MELVPWTIPLLETLIHEAKVVVGTLGDASALIGERLARALGLGETLSLMLDEVPGTVFEALPVQDEIVSRYAAFLDAAGCLKKRPFGTFLRYAVSDEIALASDSAIGAFGYYAGILPLDTAIGAFGYAEGGVSVR